MARYKNATPVAITAAATLAAIWLALNLSLGDKQIDTRLTRLYSVADAQFPRAMGAILTPALVEGPVVAQMQSAFVDNWMQTAGEVLHGEAYFPAVDAAGAQSAQVFTSSPGGGGESMQLMYLMSITAAAESIRLSASYFVPDNVAVNTLVEALERGVKVQIIVPGRHMDRAVVRRASRAEWGKLLAAGAEVYEYQPTMYHVKVMTVDDLWVSVGSTNFDNRSFSINDEANLNVYDAAFARHQIEVFEDDLKRSRRITLEEWENRPWLDKVLDYAASLLSSQL